MFGKGFLTKNRPKFLTFRVYNLYFSNNYELKGLIMSNEFSPEVLRAAHNLTPQEAEELSSLLSLFKSKNFTTSSQISSCIRANKLGEKFPNLSGVLTMENGADTWKFRGGISPKFYAIVCSYLGLSNHNSGARPVDFTSYQNLNNQSPTASNSSHTVEHDDYHVDDDNYRWGISDWVEFYGGDPSGMSESEMEAFIESQEPDFD